jgi:hypothetical protein
MTEPDDDLHIEFLRREAREEAMTDQEVDDYFGVCPVCKKHDGFINVGRSHWFFCKEHKIKWCAGSNIFSSWKEETEEEQLRIYDEIGLGSFTRL